MQILPRLRSSEIIVQELEKEFLVYDLKHHKAFHLNETSALVYKACDGETSFDGLKRKHRYSDEIIYLALDELKRNELLEESTAYVSPHAGLSRREAIRKAGLASMVALPLIAAVVAPTGAQAQSCIQPGQPATFSGPNPTTQPTFFDCRNYCQNGFNKSCCSGSGDGFIIYNNLNSQCQCSNYTCL